jgi:hypothetical protein
MSQLPECPLSLPCEQMSDFDIHVIMPEVISKDPKVLLHKAGFDSDSTSECISQKVRGLICHFTDVGAFGGRVGAPLDEGSFFIMSPNMDVIYEPPFGHERHMRFRQNFRYGDDDPLLWPQPYVMSECHLAAIPLRPQSRDPMAVMWWQVTRDEFTLSTRGIVTGVGLISGVKLAQIARLASSLQSWATAYLNDHDFPKKAEGVTILSNALKQGMTKLESLPMGLQQAGFCVSHVQRLYLELVALLDYMTVYKPRIDGRLPTAAQVASTMGAITENPMVAQDFIRAGLPVWLVRSYKEVPVTRIDSLVVMRQPADYLCLTDAKPAHRTMFVGKADDPNKYLTINKYIQYYFRYPNPFDQIMRPANAPTAAPCGNTPAQSVPAAVVASGSGFRSEYIPSRSSSSGLPSSLSNSTPTASTGKVRVGSQNQSTRPQPCELHCTLTV